MSLKLSLGGLFGKILNNSLPPDVKRLIFISSITGYLKGIQTPQSALAERINCLMKVCDRSNSLLVPIMFNSKIWSTQDLNQQLTMQGIDHKSLLSSDVKDNATMRELRLLSQAFIDHAPKFLKYGSKKKMTNDLMYLFKNYRGLQAV